MVQLNVGQTFAEYALDGLLGHGGMGSVYLARHPRLPRQVALKLLAPEVSVDEELRRRFEQEANAIARLDHPNIVGIHDRGVHDGQLWIAMQYIAGSDASRLNPRELTVERAIRIISETAAALDYAHSRGILHRDVKPANILLSAADTGRQERAVLTDFGIARLLDANTQLTSTGTFTATLAYASPEQLSGERVDHRADQYSLACTLFALLAGQSPFAATNPGQIVAGHLSRPLPQLSAIRPDVSPLLDQVLARASAKRAEHRFTSCAEFAAAAAAAVAPGQSAPQPPIGPDMMYGSPAPRPPMPVQSPMRLAQSTVPRPIYVAHRLTGGLLLTAAVLTAIASFTSVCGRTARPGSDVWSGWTYDWVNLSDSGSAVHLLGVALAVSGIIAACVAIPLLVGMGVGRPRLRRLGGYAAGLAFGVSATTVLNVLFLIADNSDDNSLDTTPDTGFWLLLVTFFVSLTAMVTSTIGSRSATASNQVPMTAEKALQDNGGYVPEGADLLAALLLILTAVLALFGAFGKLQALDSRGFPASLWAANPKMPLWVSNSPVIIAAITAAAAVALLFARKRSRRRTARVLISVTAGVFLGTTGTLLLEACSYDIYFDNSFADNFQIRAWALVAAATASVAALIACLSNSESDRSRVIHRR
ncbi:serine/threonine-protein kinase [Nocardia sp. CDC160]|uniref:serine/threonine-protein kinase n=1 Tax=Nocardia sp. CDC160 TaxID=3112166 RepID=UPI002DBDA8F3|nr:serine/threonine-protein kinase [Nocardia sp. CDC160]MEC3913298.1 serine/threonine-protein kinase [Nocardia sp. CDC160]